jgi:serine/threonine protein kinase/Flp pilus assembly protein TadD
MTAEHWQQVQELFHAALEREPGDRSIFLAGACSGNESLRQAVESLIQSHEKIGHFIDSPAFAAVAAMLTDDCEFKPGQTLGHYKIRSALGEGGMGRVYLAEDTKLKRKVALKVLPAVHRSDEQARKRLLREAQAAAALDHANICAIYEVDEESERSYIAMQYIEGETLEARMARERLSLDDALDIAEQVADALAEAHAHSIIHRDIKPSNIMLTVRGQVKVLDFGLATTATTNLAGPDEAQTKSRLTMPGIILGTVPYMSPEQVRSEPVDARTDIFSFGAVLHEMLSGRRVFARTSAAETIAAILHQEPPRLSSIDPTIPEELENIADKCLAKDAAQRYQTMQQVAQGLNAARRSEPAAMGPVTTTAKRRMTSTYGVATASADVDITHKTSSIEYLVTGVKHHKRSAMFAIVAIVIVVAAFGYYSYFAKAGEAIESIAVLPFVNGSNDANAEYLSDGISDTIIDSLSQLPNLKKVIPLSSVLRFKGKQIDPQAVGRELNVRAVLAGRLAQRSDDFLISAELIDVKDNKRLWGGQYNRKLADIVNLQSEIAQEISEKLRLRLTGEQKERLAKPQTESPEAYQLYLQGRYYRRKNTDEARIKSGEYFQKAIEKDPNYALGYAGLAGYYGSMANFGQMPPKQAWRNSEEAAVKALAIDDKLGEAHLSLAGVRMWYDWDWPGAEREIKRAIELAPHFEDVESHAVHAEFLNAMGRFVEAIAEATSAREVDPLSKHFRSNLGYILYNARRYDEAIEEYRKELEKDPNSLQAHLGLGEVYVKQGSYEEAVAEMVKARPLVNLPRQLARIGYVYAAAGKKDEATKILNEVRGQTREHYNLATFIAAIYAALGDKEQAFAWLRKGCDEHQNGVKEFKVSPRFDILRSDPRFTDLLRRVKLAP